MAAGGRVVAAHAVDGVRPAGPLRSLVAGPLQLTPRLQGGAEATGARPPRRAAGAAPRRVSQASVRVAVGVAGLPLAEASLPAA